MSLMVFGIGIVAILSLLSQSLHLSTLSLRRFEATQLAREGIELVRNMRDSNWMENFPWNDFGSASACYTSASNTALPLKDVAYRITYDENSSTVCPWTLTASPTTPTEDFFKVVLPGFASEARGTYYRVLTFDPKSPDQLIVASTVYWYHQGKTYQETLHTLLTDWKKL
jgi:hypothetical protein